MVFTEIFQKIVEYNTLFVFLKLNNLTLPIYSYQISNINQSLSSSHLFPLSKLYNVDPLQVGPKEKGSGRVAVATNSQEGLVFNYYDLVFNYKIIALIITTSKSILPNDILL